MDMKIDGDRIRREREQRAWTQEHLAGATGVSLRTIQRIETTGTSSHESLHALAAVLSLSVADLRLTETAPEVQLRPPAKWLTGRRLLTLAGALVVAAVLTPPFLVLQLPTAIALWLSVELGMLAWRRSRSAETT